MANSYLACQVGYPYWWRGSVFACDTKGREFESRQGHPCLMVTYVFSLKVILKVRKVKCGPFWSISANISETVVWWKSLLRCVVSVGEAGSWHVNKWSNRTEELFLLFPPLISATYVTVRGDQQLGTLHSFITFYSIALQPIIWYYKPHWARLVTHDIYVAFEGFG